jgi:alanyl-tRNA synthetase
MSSVSGKEPAPAAGAPRAAGAESRLYYHDATLREFTAEVVAVEGTDTGAPVRIRLNRTAFYPTSGGQPHDTGTLNGIPVIDVLEDDDGGIWHVLEYDSTVLEYDSTVLEDDSTVLEDDSTVLEDDSTVLQHDSTVLEQPLLPGMRGVQGKIDWTRRFDHMQQHTGQHLLSAAFEDMLSAPTVSFHLGNEASTIDLDIGSRREVTWDQVFAVEAAVNQVIWENRPVKVRILSRDEISSITLRKPTAVVGEIRVIEIAGYDASACGGTHVTATGEIGILKVTSLERYKGGLRVTFLSGQRALQHYQQHLQLLQLSSLALSVGPGELPQAIARLEESAKSARRELRQLREELLAYEADRLWAEAPVVNGIRVIAQVIERSLAEAQALAGRLRERPATLILLAVVEQGGARLVCARSGVPAARDGPVCRDSLEQLDAAAILREALGHLGGRGGGSATMAQGGGPEHAPEELRRVIYETLDNHDLSPDSRLSHSDDRVD